MDFIRDDYYMQAGIADLTACFNDEFLCKAVTERTEKLKIAMEDGSIFFYGSYYIDDKMFESSATHADTPKGLLRNNWSKCGEYRMRLHHKH